MGKGHKGQVSREAQVRKNPWLPQAHCKQNCLTAFAMGCYMNFLFLMSLTLPACMTSPGGIKEKTDGQAARHSDGE